MGRFGCMMGRFGQCNGPFSTIFLDIKIFGAVLVEAVLAMGRFGIDQFQLPATWVDLYGAELGRHRTLKDNAC